MRLTLPPVQSRIFSVETVDGKIQMTAEISDFGPGFRFQSLYDDACDVGMAVQSSTTGAVVHYYLHETEVKENEVVCWFLKPTTESIRQHPKCVNTLIMLFND